MAIDPNYLPPDEWDETFGYVRRSYLADDEEILMGTEIAERPETGMTTMMERLATSPDVDVAKLEKLLEMQERVLARDAEAAFNSAFANLQADMPIVSEEGAIRHNNKLISRYAKFEDINEAVKPILKDNGFGVSFRVEIVDTRIIVTGILMHREGHREQTSMALPADTSGSKNAVQAMGSSVSYGKRYVLCALLNISTRGEDDDGHKGGLGKTITEKQVAELEALIQEVGADKPRFLRHIKANSLEEIQATAYNHCVKELEAKRKQHERPAKN